MASISVTSSCTATSSFCISGKQTGSGGRNSVDYKANHAAGLSIKLGSSGKQPCT